MSKSRHNRDNSFGHGDFDDDNEYELPAVRNKVDKRSREREVRKLAKKSGVRSDDMEGISSLLLNGR